MVTYEILETAVTNSGFADLEIDGPELNGTKIPNSERWRDFQGFTDQLLHAMPGHPKASGFVCSAAMGL